MFINFVKSGGVLTGLSAGAIMMTPRITSAGYPAFDRDDNIVNLKRLNGLNLVNFEFFPHYQNTEKYQKTLLSESRKINYPLYAVSDGGGIIVDGKTIKFVGKVWTYNQGRYQKVF